MPLVCPRAGTGLQPLAPLHQVSVEGHAHLDRDEGEVPRIEAAMPGQCSSPVVLTHALSSNQAPGDTHKCILRGSECTVVLPPEAVLMPSDNFTITFHHCMSGREQVSLVDPEYLPRRHGEQRL